MISKSLKLCFWTTLFAVTVYVPAAYASGEDGGNAQSPAQVIVQIVVAAIVLKVLAKFDLP